MTQELPGREELPVIPPEVQEQIKRIVSNPKKTAKVLSIVQQSISLKRSPIPFPDDLEKYEKILPGIAEKIIGWTQTQHDHRILIEKKVITHQVRESTTGQWMGFIIALVCISASLYAALNGHDNFACILGSGTPC